MVTNKVSAALSDTDKVSVMTAIGQARKKLPFLINLGNENRKKTRKMGPKSVEYVNLNLQGAQSFGSLIPARAEEGIRKSKFVQSRPVQQFAEPVE